MLIWLSAAAACLWISLLLLPWRPWSTRDRLQVNAGEVDLGNVSVLIPARDEAVRTGEIAKAHAIENLLVIDGTTPDPGWSGKLWPLQQGLELCDSHCILPLDADIGLNPGAVGSLLERLAALVGRHPAARRAGFSRDDVETSAIRYGRGERSRWKGRTDSAVSLTGGVRVPDGNELSSGSTFNGEGAQDTGQE